MDSSTNGNSFADALARARQIAAIYGNTPSKRPNEDDYDDQPEAKKVATEASSNSSTDARKALAAAAASQLNARLGVTATSPPLMVSTQPSMQGTQGLADPREIAKMLGFTVTTNETTTVPDKMVGYLIGKGGEQITSIQAESQCVVQFAADSNGTPDRPCVLTGTPASIAKAKEVLNRLLQKFKSGAGTNDESSNQIEVMVPGNKVGLIIGKGGETIKGLMESTCTKIVIIQESNVMTSQEKPVRITGEYHNCQRAQQKILELVSDKDFQATNPYGTPISSDPYRTNIEISIPRNMVGLVIGKSGEMIRKIQDESGSKVQFKGEDDGTSSSRFLSITGNEETNRIAAQMVSNLIDSTSNKYGPGMSFQQPRGPHGASNAYNLPVPTEKCGIIIGKGGETIREVNRISGAFVELDRNIGPNPDERIFKIAGSPDQIQHAVRLMTEKANLPNPMMGPDGYCGSMGYPGPMGGQMRGPGYRGPYGPPNQPGMGGPMGMMGGPMPGQMMHGMMGAGGMMPNAQPWAAYNQAAYGQQGQTDPSKQSAEPQQQQQQPNQQQTPQQQQENAAAWAAYYAQYYSQAMQMNYGAAASAAGSSTTATTASQAQGTQQQASSNGQTEDYSQAWVEYYKSQGMGDYATAIMQQQQQQQMTQQQQQQGAQPPQPPQ